MESTAKTTVLDDVCLEDVDSASYGLAAIAEADEEDGMWLSTGVCGCLWMFVGVCGYLWVFTAMQRSDLSVHWPAGVNFLVAYTCSFVPSDTAIGQ